MKELFFHELTHSAHYAALGNGWYTSFVANEAFEIISNFGSGYAPYGNGVNGNSPQVGLGEGWAYYIGHIFSDMQYPTNADCQDEQNNLPGTNWCIYNGTGHPHLDVEENFNPNLTADPFHWIPQGLYYDLNDITNEQKATGGYVNDNVSNYTNRQMFNAFQSNIYTYHDYMLKLLQQNNNNQAAQVTSLFSDYHY